MSLIAHYPLNGDALDYSGNGYHLTNIGSSSLTGSGKIGQCLSLTGNAAQYLYYSNFPIYKYKFSWSVWAYCNGTNPAGFAYIVSQGRDNTVSGINIATNQAGDNILIFIGNYGIITIPISCISVWRHIVVTGDGNNIKVYVDGVLQSTIAQPSDINFTYATDNALVIGKMTYSYTSATYYFPFNGKINDVRIYDHALSEKEIKEIAKAKILHYTFDDFQEPTTNKCLLYTENDQNPITGDGSPTLSQIDSTVLFRGLKTIKFITGTSGNFYLNGSGDIATDVTSTNWASTVYIKRSDGASLSNIGTYMYITNNTNINQTADTIEAIEDGWYKITRTRTGLTAGYPTLFGCYNLGASTTYYIAMWQIEAKPYVTPYVMGSRGGIINDQSGFRNNAILAESTTPQWVSDSKIGSGAYKFNGSTTKFDLNNLSTSDNKLTMSAWVYTNSLTKTSSIIRKNYSFLLQTDTSGSFRPHVYTDGAWINVSTQNNTVQLNKWQHLSAVYDGTNLIAYVDGVEVGRVAKTGNINPSSEVTTFGYYATTEWHDGYIDDIRVYSTALSNTHILELYQTRASLDNNGNLLIGQITENVEGTVNLFPNITGQSSKYNLSQYSGKQDNVGGSYSYPTSIHGTYTLSADIRLYPDDGATNPRMGIVASYSDATTTSNTNFNGYIKDGVLRRISVTLTTNNTKTLTSIYGWVLDYSTANVRHADAFNIQLEYKDHDTGFANGTRLQPESLSSSFVYGNGIKQEGIASFDRFSELGVTDGLVAYYPLDKDARDYSGNGNHGTVSGAVLNSGVKGGAYSFDGTDDSISINNNVSLNPTSGISVSAWIYWRDTSVRWEWLVAKNMNSGGLNGYMLSKHADSSKIAFHVNGISAGWACSNFIANTWYHIVGTASAGETLSFYVNGLLKESVGTVPNPIVQNTNNLGINKTFYYTSPNALNGIIDEVRIYNRALSAEEISILYETTAPTTAAMKITKDNVYLKGEFKEVI